MLVATDRPVADAESPASRRAQPDFPYALPCATALVGFLVGVFVRPAWTHNLIGAQILSGIVPYPSDSVMPALYGTPHSILIDLAAVLLRLGLAEWTISLFFSGLQAALGCAALAMLTFAFSRSLTTSFLVPVLLLRFGETALMWPAEYLAVFHGHFYPNIFPVSPAIFGETGMFMGILALAFLALGQRRRAGILLGLLPAVHVGLALPFVGGVAFVLLLSRRRSSPICSGTSSDLARGFAAGFAVFAATALWHYGRVPTAPIAEGASDAAQISRAFVEQWDDHAALLMPGAWKGFFESEYYTLFLAISCLTYLRRHITSDARAVVWVVLTITLSAVAFTIALNLAPERIPWPVRALLIPRWLNLSSWFFPVVALSLLGRLAFERRNTVAAIALGGAGLLVWTRFARTITAAGTLAYVDVAPIPWIPVLLWGLAFPLLIVLSACLLAASDRGDGTGRPTMPAGIARRIGMPAMLIVLWALPFRNAAWSALPGPGPCAGVIAQARAGNGMLLLGAELWNVEWIQVRTRRPVLLDPMDFNVVGFTPKAGPRLAEILKKVYGADVIAGPPRRLDERWPGYSLAQWQHIAGEFGVVEVLAESGMAPALPVVVDDGQCALYRIPIETGG